MPIVNRRQVGYGLTSALPDFPPMPVNTPRNPNANDFAELGTIWTNTATGGVFILSRIVAGVPTWSATAGAAGTLTVTPGPFIVTATVNAPQQIYLHANGGAAETIDIHSDQGTGVASVNVHSDVGGVTITSGLATADAINITATNAAGGIDIDSGTAGIIADTTGGISLDAAAASNFTVTGAGIDLTLASVGGSVAIASDEAVANAINLDASDAAGGIVIQTSGNPGNVDIVPAVDTNAGVAATIDAIQGVSTHTGLTTAAGAFETITITCAIAVATSGILVSAANLGANDAKMTVERVIPGAGTFDVILKNDGAAALNGDLIISFWVLS